MKRNKPIRILHVIGGMDRGGAESLVMNIAQGIDRNKFEPVILTFTSYSDGLKKYAYSNDLKKLGIKVVKISDNRFKNPARFVKDIEKVILSEKIDIVHSHIDMMSALSLRAAQKTGVKLRIAHSHNAFSHRYKNPLLRPIGYALKKILLHEATELLACSDKAGRFLYGKKENFCIINNGIDLEKYKFDKLHRQEIRSKYKISSGDKVFLNVGRLEYQKNHIKLIDIFSKYAEKDSNAKLIIVGDGTEKDTLIKKIKSLGLETQIILLPSTDLVHKFYSAADAFIMTSRFEGLPFVAVEAQANGLPLVLSDAISNEVDITGNTVFLSLDDSDHKWTEQMGRINTEISSRITGYKKMKNGEYDVGAMIAKLEEIYSKMNEVK